MKATNILWDIDEDDGIELPTEMELPEGMTDEDEISDYLSDETGYCHKGFDIEGEEKVCAECGAVCTDNYYMVGDNYLQVKYFDSNEDNIFCSKDCLCEALSVLNVIDGEY